MHSVDSVDIVDYLDSVVSVDSVDGECSVDSVESVHSVDTVDSVYNFECRTHSTWDNSTQFRKRSRVRVTIEGQRVLFKKILQIKMFDV